MSAHAPQPNCELLVLSVIWEDARLIRNLRRTRLAAVLPIARATTGVRHGDDVDVVLANSIHNFVRKPCDSQLPVREPTHSWRADLRVRPNQVDRLDNRVVEIAAQPRSAHLVPPNGLGHFV